MSLAATNRGAVLGRAVSGHPVEALALHEDRDPAHRGRAGPPLYPGRPARPGRGAGLRPARGGASPSSRTCSTRTPARRPTPSVPWNWRWPRPRPTATSRPACTSWPPGRDPRRCRRGLPPGRAAPRYGEATLADVLPGAAAASACGGARRPPRRSARPHRGPRRCPPGGRPPRRRPRRRPAARPRRLAPTLAALAGPVGDLSAPCPSTTPVSLATPRHRLPPGSHGILGFVTAVPGEQGAARRTAPSTTSSGPTTPIPTRGRPAGPSSSRLPTRASPSPRSARTPTRAPGSPCRLPGRELHRLGQPR